MTDAPLITVIAITALLAAICFGACKADRDLRRKCIEAGGYAAEVHSGRGGWVCLEAGR